MALRWTSALAVGVRGIDEQHQELFRRFERLEDAILHRDRTEAGRMLDFLADYVRVHFDAEEALMRVVGYPDLERHRAEHEGFKAAVSRLDLKLAEHGSSAELVLRLDRDVGGWLRDHIYGSDVTLARFVKARRWTGTVPTDEALPLDATVA
ncbi:MAG: bacteriohemerythrin [Anaeromyxobacter sp.]